MTLLQRAAATLSLSLSFKFFPLDLVPLPLLGRLADLLRAHTSRREIAVDPEAEDGVVRTAQERTAGVYRAHVACQALCCPLP